MESAILVVAVIALMFLANWALGKYRLRKKEQDEERFTAENMGSLVDAMKVTLALESREAERDRLYERIARQEGDERTAYLFRAFAEAEEVHYDVVKKVLIQLKMDPKTPKAEPDFAIGTTYENLLTTAQEEREQAADYYARFALVAKQEKQKTVYKVFKQLEKVEVSHADLIEAYLADDAAGGSATKLALCPTCGAIEIGQTSSFCLCCSQPGFNYKRYADWPGRNDAIPPLAERSALDAGQIEAAKALQEAPEARIDYSRGMPQAKLPDVNELMEQVEGRVITPKDIFQDAAKEARGLFGRHMGKEGQDDTDPNIAQAADHEEVAGGAPEARPGEDGPARG